MTIETTHNRKEYTGDGATTVFSYDFLIQATSDLLVYDDGVLKTEVTHYTVSGAGDVSGGNVTFVTAPLNSNAILIIRSMPITQAIVFPAGGAFPAKSNEEGLDRAAAIHQDRQEEVGRAIKLPVGSLLEDIDLPAPSALKLFRWNAAADGLETVSVGSDEVLGVITTKGDLVIGDASGSPTRLGVGPTGALLNVVSGQPAYLAVGTEGQRLEVVSGIPAWATAAVVTPGDALARNNIALLAFKLATQNGFAIFQMVDGIMDEFEDETGVDNGASLNEVYDAAADLYGNTLATPSASGEWTGGANFSYSGDDVNKDSNGNASLRTDDTFTADFSYYGKPNGSFSGSEGTLGVYDVAENATFSGSDSKGAMQSMTESYYLAPRTSSTTWDVEYGGVSKATVVIAEDGTDNMRFSRVGTTVSLYKNDVLVHAFAETTSNELRAVCGIWGAAQDWLDVQWSQAPLDLTLIAEDQAASGAAPTDVHMVVFEQDGGVALTVNTDIKAYASRDGGTTWTQVTLADEGNYASGQRVLIGTADISGQPSGTTMTYKITTHNAKDMKLHGVSLLWY